jgi:hypothetical protein
MGRAMRCSAFGRLAGPVLIRMARLPRSVRGAVSPLVGAFGAGGLARADLFDVGCGIGRNSYWPMVYGGAGELAIDIYDRFAGDGRADRRTKTTAWSSE